MKRTLPSTWAAFALASVLTLAGCGQSPETPPAGEQASEQATPTPTVSEAYAKPSAPIPATAQAGAVGPEGNFVVNLVDKDGYTFDVSVRVKVTDLGETVANDKPGSMSANFKVAIEMGLTSTTPGRTIKFEQINGVAGNESRFTVLALWQAGSPVCVAGGVPDRVCATRLGDGIVNSAFPAGQTVPLKTYRSRSAGIGLAESDWPTVKEELKNAIGFAVSYDGADTERFDCPAHSSFLGPIVASKPAGYECGAVKIGFVKAPAAAGA